MTRIEQLLLVTAIGAIGTFLIVSLFFVTGNIGVRWMNDIQDERQKQEGPWVVYHHVLLPSETNKTAEIGFRWDGVVVWREVK